MTRLCCISSGLVNVIFTRWLGFAENDGSENFIWPRTTLTCSSSVGSFDATCIQSGICTVCVGRVIGPTTSST